MPALPQSASRITLRARPKGLIEPDLTGKGTFNLEKGVKLPSLADLKEGNILVRVEWLSLDPAMRGWLNDSRSYLPPVQIGEVMRSGGVGRVVLTKDPKFVVGDWVSSTLGWQEFADVKAKDCVKLHIGADTSPSHYLGVLGMPGQTAYWGMLDVAKVQAGETVVVSGAAGAVGSVACQIAKIKGARVIALAGGADKCKFLKETLGVDVAIDYKSADFVKTFKKEVGYLDVYFDNVGGEILDLALTRLKKGARIAREAYNDPSPPGIKMYLNLISQRAKIEGFIVFDYASRYHIAESEMAQWINEDKLKVQETRLEGIESCVDGLCGLFRGENLGKLVVKVGKAGEKL